MISAFLVSMTGSENDSILTTIRTLYLNIVNELLYHYSTFSITPATVTVMNEKSWRFKLLAKNLFKSMDEFNLFTVKFRLLDPIALYGALNFLHASRFQHFNFFIKTLPSTTSVRRHRTLWDAVRGMNVSFGTEESWNNTGTKVCGGKLVTDSRAYCVALMTISNLFSPAHINLNGREEQVSKCLWSFRKHFWPISYGFRSCDVFMKFSKSKLIYGGVVVTVDRYNDQNGRIILK